jgi:hypothetical protein
MSTILKPERFKNRDIGRLRTVLMLDEGRTLVDFRYYNAFRWVFDNVIERAWMMANCCQTVEPLPFVAIFLGTNSKVADFLPAGVDSSYRYYTSFVKVPQPFTALDWDVHVSEPYKLPTLQDNILPGSSNLRKSNMLAYSHLEKMGWLSRFGRPVWYGRWALKERESCEMRHDEAQRLIKFAEGKLHHLKNQDAFERIFEEYDENPQRREEYQEIPESCIRTCYAILAVLVGLDFDFTSPIRAADLVASRLRWALGCDPSRRYMFTTYLSEPILAEAASRLFFLVLRSTGRPVYPTILKVIAKEIGKGNYDPGKNGELAARIMCTKNFWHPNRLTRFRSTGKTEQP